MQKMTEKQTKHQESPWSIDRDMLESEGKAPFLLQSRKERKLWRQVFSLYPRGKAKNVFFIDAEYMIPPTRTAHYHDKIYQQVRDFLANVYEILENPKRSKAERHWKMQSAIFWARVCPELIDYIETVVNHPEKVSKNFFLLLRRCRREILELNTKDIEKELLMREECLFSTQFL